jgi:hypothetical protein
VSQTLCNLIAQPPFFKGLTAHQLQLLAESALEMQFETGQSIFGEGSPANRFYLILEGKVVLESELEGHGTIPVQTLGPGDDFGWAWLFPPHFVFFDCPGIGADQNPILLWASVAGAARRRPRVRLSTHQTNRGCGDALPRERAAALKGTNQSRQTFQ